MKNKHIIIGLLIILAFITSCSPVAVIEIKDNGEVFVDLNVTPTNSTETVIKNLSAGETTSLYDKAMLETSLKNENIIPEKIELINYAGISTKVRIPANKVKESKLFDVDIENKRIACNLNKETIKTLLETFPAEMKDYLDLLMSPIMTGENLTASEYEDLISAGYGSKIANELKTSFFKITVACPGKVDSVKYEPTGKVRYFTGNSATITVPLSSILTLEKPILITITYN